MLQIQIKDALLGCLQEEECCGCCIVGFGSDLLWDTMRLHEILNVIVWHWMHGYVYVYYVCKHHAKPCRSMYMYF